MLDFELLAVEEEQTGNGYERIIVEDRIRAEAQADFVAELLETECAFPGIVFVRRRRHAEILSEVMTDRLGFAVPAISSQVPKKERNAYAQLMRERQLKVAVCTSVWSTGIDIPALEWVLIAGAGQAPAGLKQMFGRGTRLEEDKAGYTVYDWQDIGEGCEAYEEQSELRMQHYAATGLGVGAPKPPADVSDNSDVARLSRLLAKEKGTTVEESVPEPMLGAPEFTGQASRLLAAALWVGIIAILFVVLPTVC